MGKYLISFVLFAFIALEQSIIYGRQHSRTQQPRDDPLQMIAHGMRPSQQHHRRSTQTQLPHQIHKRSHRAKSNRPHAVKAHQSSWQKYAPPDDVSSAVERHEREEATAALRRYIHIHRHMAHQQAQLRQHKDRYHRSDGELELVEADAEPARDAFSMRMPRIWQHLGGGTEELMFRDDPRDYSDEAQSLDVSLPLEESNEVDDLVQPALEAKRNSLQTAEQQKVKVPHKKHAIPKRGCPKCESNRRVQHVSEEELTQLRIEYVKQQILEKLRLKERPNVSAVGLPKPIYEGTTIEEEEDERAKNRELDDYYARTSKKFIFLQKEKRECQRLGTNTSMCFSFKIDDADADGFDVSTAVLWLFKSKSKRPRQHNDTILNQQTIVVSEMQQNMDPKYLPIVKTIAIQSVDVQDEWMKIDIEWPIKRWFGNHDLSHLIHISCRTCDITSMEEIISVDKDYRPFIMVDTQNRRRVSRQKRGINCTDGVTECCREKLYISFDEIGWGDWIIQPRGYDAYFCRGSCGSVASVTQSATHHSTFLQKVVSSRRNRGSKPLELIPCCTAKQYSSLQLVFMDSNNTATQKTFPNMVVESCGCR